MGVPVRPNKPVGGLNGTVWLAGNDLLANELEADIVELYTVLTGNIDTTNIKALAGILGTQLADNTISTIKIINNAITDAKLSSDVAVDGNRAVGANHIKNDVVGFRALNTVQVSAGNVPSLVDGATADMDIGIPHASTLPICVFHTNPTASRLQTGFKKGVTNWILTVYNGSGSPLDPPDGEFTVVYVTG